MTRFMMEITGLLDEQVAQRTGKPNDGFWKKNAEKDMWNAVADMKKMNIDENGVATWKSNGNCPMDDLLEMLEYAGVAIINYENTRKVRDEQNRKFAEEYRERMKNHVPTEEELFEMRAAFGKGTTVVDAITGQTYRL